MEELPSTSAEVESARLSEYEPEPEPVKKTEKVLNVRHSYIDTSHSIFSHISFFCMFVLLLIDLKLLHFLQHS